MSHTVTRRAGPSHRLERVGESIRHAIAEILLRGEVVEPLLAERAVTVAAVKMSPDLRLATVAVTPLGGEGAETMLAALDAHKKELRALVARRVNLKFAPELRFVLDRSFAAQAEVDALLRSPSVARDLVRDDERPK